MKWQELFDVNRYGECIADDVEDIVERIEAYIHRRNGCLELKRNTLIMQILQYIQLRHTRGALAISTPQTIPSVPEGWSDYDEEIWQDWLHHTHSIEGWRSEVMHAVFGYNVHLWELRCEGWRDELFDFLPWWISRSLKVVEEFDPNPPEEEEEETIDPYLMDHGSSRRTHVM